MRWWMQLRDVPRPRGAPLARAGRRPLSPGKLDVGARGRVPTELPTFVPDHRDAGTGGFGGSHSQDPGLASRAIGYRNTPGAKQRARHSKFGGFNMAESLTGVPTISGLDESFDRIIRGLPQSFFRGGLGVLQPDDAAPDRISQLRDPFTVMGRVRDTVGGVVLRGADGTYAGLNIRNIFLHDLSKPHAVALSHAAVSQIGTDRNRFINVGAYGAHAKAHGHTINT